MEVGWVWLPKVRLDGALAPKVKPPPDEAGGAAGVVAWTLVGPNGNPVKELAVPVVVAAAAARVAAAGAAAAGAAVRVAAAGVAVRVAARVAAAGAAAGWEA